ncbi:MAG: protein kinase [Oscillospiraceae bacterium]|nr:protein kinase [Oscillospiraceae bacterium]
MTGKVLAARYELLNKVGEGGMATVYRALDRNTKKFVAVKILREELSDDNEFVRRFEHETIIGSRMTHPNIASLLDVGEEDGLRFIVFEFVDGTSLKQLVQKYGAIRPDIALNIAIRILNALSHAHKQGIVHRDIKPQNILIDNQKIIKVLDFGISQLVGTAGEQLSDSAGDRAIGSVHYFSPEQAGGKPADERSDVYSVGVVMYEMLTGRQPFPGENPVAVSLAHLEDAPKPPADLNPNVTPALSAIVMRAMEKRPEKRFQDAVGMIRAIKQATIHPNVAIETPRTSELPSPEQIKKQSRRLKFYRKLITTSIAALLSVIIILLIGSVLTNVVRQALERVVLPDVTNMTYDAASVLLTEKGLTVRRTERVMEIGTEGLVIDQSPRTGALLSPGDDVLLTVSVSEFDLVMPDLTHMSEAAASERIRELKMVVGSRSIIASEAMEGQVIGQTPAAGAKVKFGQVVLLRVSGGLVIVPNFIGTTEQIAMASIPSQLVLSDVKIVTVNDSVKDGIVIDQSPAAYERAATGSAITLTIGRLETRVFTGAVEISLTLANDSFIRAVLVLDDGTEEMQYSALHPRGQSTASFAVRADTQGEYTLLVYGEEAVIQSTRVIID